MAVHFKWQDATGWADCIMSPDRPPLLSASDGRTALTLTSGRERVSPAHLAFARELAEQAGRYAEECARWATQPALLSERDD